MDANGVNADRYREVALFFRRGPDVGGLNWWAGQVDAKYQAGQDGRAWAIGQMQSTGEWGAKLSAISNQGCYQ